ncbi:hypothetical protein HQ576_03020, partial [bacterium]|nr:hypothetical protein [bacterium]
MLFLKKHVFWILLVLALLAEGGLTYVLVGKQTDARAMRTEYEQKKQQLDAFERKPPGQPKVLKALGERKAAVRDELTDCLLFLWHRGEALEQLFDDERLAAANVTPWSRHVEMGMGRFKLLYQNTYDAHVEKLAPKMEKVLISRKALGLAPSNFFTLTDIRIGDIFSAQKKFWVLKEVVDIAADSNMASLAKVQVTREALDGPVRGRAAPTRKGTLQSAVTVQLIVRCEYPKLSNFVERLHASSLGIRILSVSNIQRAAGVASAGSDFAPAMRAPRMPGPPMMMPPPGGMSAERGLEGGVVIPPTPRRPIAPGAPGIVPAEVPVAARSAKAGEVVQQLVEAQILCEVPDVNLDIYQVAFSKAAFPKKSDVKTWAEQQVAAAEAILLRAKTTRAARWAEAAIQKLPAPPPEKAAEPGKAAAPAAATKPHTLVAYPGTPYEREYVVSDPALARTWLANVASYEVLHVRALKTFWEHVLAALDTERTSTRDGVVITFRDKIHFDADAANMYEQTLTVA